MNWLKGILIWFFGILMGLAAAYFIMSYFGQFARHIIPKKIFINLPTEKNDGKDEFKPTVIYPQNDKEIVKKKMILMYHYIDDTNLANKGLYVAPANFSRQLMLLNELNYQTVTASGMTNSLKSDFSDKREVAITFDDGYDDVYLTAYPLMKKYDMVGTIYLVTDFIGKPGYMSETQIKELMAAGFEVGAHSLSHPNLANASLANARLQIENSKNILDEMLGINVTSFCYPSGKYDSQVEEIVKEAGYTNAVTTVSRVLGENEDFYLLPRVRVSGNDTLVDFISNILL